MFRAAVGRETAGDDLLARHVELDAHFEETTLMVMPVRPFDHDPTTADAIEDFLQVRTRARMSASRALLWGAWWNVMLG